MGRVVLRKSFASSTGAARAFAALVAGLVPALVTALVPASAGAQTAPAPIPPAYGAPITKPYPPIAQAPATQTPSAYRPTYPPAQPPRATAPTYPPATYYGQGGAPAGGVPAAPPPAAAPPAPAPHGPPPGVAPAQPGPVPPGTPGAGAPPGPVPPGGAVPAPGAPGAVPPGAVPPGAAPPVSPADAASRRGLVFVEKDGRPLALGAVLGGDGRMITALSSIGPTETVEVRYTDGTTQKARVGHRDPVWDLALLVPATNRWKEGLRASDVNPVGISLQTYVPARPKAVLVPVVVRGRGEARARGGEVMPDTLDVEVRAMNVWPGAPVVDDAGGVVGLLVRACRLNERGACMPTLVAAPVQALRSFLSRTPATAVTPAPFLGIQGVSETEGAIRGVRVVAVAPNSPAEKGELRAKTDVIVAVDAQPVDSPEKLADCIGRRNVGEAVKLLVFGGDKFREVAVVLKAAP